MSQTQTTTSTTTTSTTQTTQSPLTVGTSTTTYNLGNYVTDVSLNPYIAQQIVAFIAYGMRPNINLHAFFNSMLVDTYCAPGIKNSNNSIDSSSANVVLQTNAYGTQLVSDNNGVCCGLFNIPESTFKTGTVAFELCDVNSILQGNQAITTSAFTQFTASDLMVTTQGITLTTINPVVSVAAPNNNIVQANTANSTPVKVNIKIVEPIAQAFTFSTANGEVGTFLTAIDLFFEQRSLTGNNGVTVYVCETNNGYPDTTNILPFSVVHINGNQILTSNDASVATTATFESPVFVNSDTFYTFVVIPDGNDPDIRAFYAALGDTDISSGYQVYSQPNCGTMFEGATTSAWTALQNQYLKFNLYSTVFSQLSGNAVFNNTNRDYIAVGSFTYVNTSAGVMPGDYVFSSTNSTVSTANALINGTLKYYDISHNLLYVGNSTGNFVGTSYIQVHRFANGTIGTPNTATLIASANSTGPQDQKLNVFVTQLGELTPAGTKLSFYANSTSNTYSVDANTFQTLNDTGIELHDYERLVMSYSNEVANLGGQKSLTQRVSLSSDSYILSPLIDTIRSDVLDISNLVSPLSSVIYDEMFNYGTTKTKYLSLPITLTAGQTPNELRVVIDAYRPYSSYIKAYARFLNSSDPEALSNKTWTPLDCDGDNLYSAYGNTSSYNTFNYTVPTGYGAYALSGTVTINNTSTNVVGSGTNFTSWVTPGRYVSFSGDYSQQVVSVANDTFMTIANTFTSSWVANTLYLVPPPTTAWLSTNSVTQISGNVVTSTVSNIITGTNTNFLTVFSPGTIIMCANDSQVVVSVTNNTSLSVGTAWSSNASGANAYIATIGGINYLNSQNSLFVGYNQLQLKVVLLSDDTANVPILKDVQLIALTC